MSSIISKPYIFIFIFSGVDGSGKSTHAKLLYVYARQKGLRARYTWLRWSPFLTNILLLYALLCRKTIRITIMKNSCLTVFKLHIFWMDPVLKTLYPKAFLLDLLFRYLLELLYAYVKHFNLIIIDRFLLDVIADLLWETRNVTILKYTEFKILLRLASKPRCYNVVFLADPFIIARRKKDIISLKEIKFKYSVLKLLAKKLDLEIWDTTNVSIHETFNFVKDRFHKYVKLNAKIKRILHDDINPYVCL